MSLLVISISHGLGRGTKVVVQADPVIEEFISSLGDGTTRLIQDGGFIISKAPLELYEIRNGEFPLPAFSNIVLDQINRPFIVDDKINLSFLRIKGLSMGIEFHIRTILSVPAMSELKMTIGKAVRQLSREYILPAGAKLTIVQEEGSRGGTRP